MANVLIEENSIANTAAAIRRKTGSSTLMKASEFESAINGISTDVVDGAATDMTGVLYGKNNEVHATPFGSSGQVFKMGAAGVPVWGEAIPDKLPIANGGTGQTTASAAFNALAAENVQMGANVNICGNLRLKGSKNFGNQLNFGDGNYTYLLEDTDDHLTIFANKGVAINGNACGVTIFANKGVTINGNSSGVTIEGNLTVTGTASVPVAASDITGTLPIDKGGTGATTTPSLLVNLASTTAANPYTATPRPGVTGTLPVANGGTGATTTPSLLVNLASTTAANPYTATPRPGVTGTLPVANGGTGTTTAPSLLVNLASTTAANPYTATPRPGVTGTLPIAQGGTGQTTASAAFNALTASSVGFNGSVTFNHSSIYLDTTSSYTSVMSQTNICFLAKETLDGSYIRMQTNANGGVAVNAPIKLYGSATSKRRIIFSKATTIANAVGETNTIAEIASTNAGNLTINANSIEFNKALPIASGGTGQTTASAAFNALGENLTGIKIGSNAVLTTFSVAIGWQVAASYYSVAIGSLANAANYGTAIGSSANANSSGVAIGANTSAQAANSVAIGANASATSEGAMVLGNTSRIQTIVAAKAISTASDIRDKTDIEQLDDHALEFLSKLHPIQYVRNHREWYQADEIITTEQVDTGNVDENGEPIYEERSVSNLTKEDKLLRSKYGLGLYDKEAHAAGTKKGERLNVGVSAQEIVSALTEVYGTADYADIVNDNFHDFDPDTIMENAENKLTVTYEKFIPFLIKGIQELKAQVDILKAKL